MKRISTFLALIAILFALPGTGWGQATIFNITSYSALPTGWVGNNNVTTNQIVMSTYFLLDAGAPPDNIVTSSYDLSGYASATFTCSVATFGSGTNFPAKIEYSNDGGTSWTSAGTTATPTSSTYILSGDISITSLSSTFKLRISNNGASGRGVRLQNLKLVGNTSSCTPPTTQATATAATNVLAT